jgi:hypothetical protein
LFEQQNIQLIDMHESVICGSVSSIITDLRLTHCTEEERTTINAIRSNPLDAMINAMERPNFKPQAKLDVVRTLNTYHSLRGIILQNNYAYENDTLYL